VSPSGQVQSSGEALNGLACANRRQDCRQRTPVQAKKKGGAMHVGSRINRPASQARNSGEEPPG
jgi:hypothetical protein